MHRNLIVARMNAADADAVAKIFAESDATDLPRQVGVVRRTLFRFHELYFHLVEAAAPIEDKLYRARNTALYEDINAKLGQHISPYDPAWHEPKDAMAIPFYSWRAC